MSESSSNVLLGLLQLSRRAREATSVQELGFIAVNETRGLLNYRQAALWLGDAGGRVQAISGVAQPDSTAPFVQWLARLFKQAVPVNEARRLQTSELPQLLVEEWNEWLPSYVLLVPVPHAQLDVPGVLLLARDSAWLDAELPVAMEVGALYGHALFALRPARRPVAWLRQRLSNKRMLVRVAIAALVVSLFPVRLSSLAPAEVTAVDPDVMRAPLDGIIDQLAVQPNQVVAAGDALFALDATVLQGQHSAASKAVEAAQEQYRQAAQLAVVDEKARLEMARRLGELRLNQVELQHATAQLARVQVKAAHAGVVVFDGVDDWTGKAVATGEKVLMLADPDKVEITAFMPAGEQVNLKAGAKVVFYPKGSPFSSYTGTVQSVAYRASTTEEGVLAYKVKARLPADADLPRLGLSGSARLYAGRVPLIYYALRRPMVTVRQWLGW